LALDSLLLAEERTSEKLNEKTTRRPGAAEKNAGKMKVSGSSRIEKRKPQSTGKRAPARITA